MPPAKSPSSKLAQSSPKPIFGKLHEISGLGLFIGLPATRRTQKQPSSMKRTTSPIISLVIFGGLYLLLWPLTAPVGSPVASWIPIAALGTFLATVNFVILKAETGTERGRSPTCERSRFGTRSQFPFSSSPFSSVSLHADRAIPHVRNVLILVIAVSWILGGFAFFFDGYHVPVLTLLLVSLVVPRMFHLDRTLYMDSSGVHARNGQEEYYLSITSAKDAADSELAEPSKISRNA